MAKIDCFSCENFRLCGTSGLLSINHFDTAAEIIEAKNEESVSLSGATTFGVVSTGGTAAVGGNDRLFSSLSDVVSEKTLKAIEEMGFSEMMEIQYRSIRPLLEGR